MKSPIKDCSASRVASTKEDAFPVKRRHFHVYSSLERSPCLVMATVRGKSLNIAIISCSSSRLARSEVSTTCVSPSRHQMHSLNRSFFFSHSPYHYNEPEIIPALQSSTTTTNLVVVPQSFLGGRSALIETWPSVRGNKKHPGCQRPRCYCVSSSIAFS